MIAEFPPSAALDSKGSISFHFAWLPSISTYPELDPSDPLAFVDYVPVLTLEGANAFSGISFLLGNYRGATGGLHVVVWIDGWKVGGRAMSLRAAASHMLSLSVQAVPRWKNPK